MLKNVLIYLKFKLNKLFYIFTYVLTLTFPVRDAGNRICEDCWCSAPVSVTPGESRESKGDCCLFRVIRDTVTLEQALWGREAQIDGSVSTRAWCPELA